MQDIAIKLHTVQAGKAHRLRTVTMHEDALVRVLEGEKHIHNGAGSWRVAAPNWLLMAADMQWDVVNSPGASGLYRSQVLSFGQAGVKQFHTRHPQFLQLAATRSAEVMPITSLGSSLQQAVDTMVLALQSRGASSPMPSSVHSTSPVTSRPLVPSPALLYSPISVPISAPLSVSVLNHRAEELLLLLAETGRVFGLPCQHTWAQRVRQRVAQQPHKEWSVRELAQSFHMSASSLQRRLAVEDIGVAHLVREVRLEAALNLLQSSSLPVSEVAQRCGYASHSRFSAAFKTRFGLPPSDLRVT